MEELALIEIDMRLYYASKFNYQTDEGHNHRLTRLRNATVHIDVRNGRIQSERIRCVDNCRWCPKKANQNNKKENLFQELKDMRKLNRSEKQSFLVYYQLFVHRDPAFY